MPDSLSASPPSKAAHSDKRFGQAMLLFFVACCLLLTLGVAAQMASLTWGLAFTLLFLILLPAVLFTRGKGQTIRAGLRLHPISAGIAIVSLLTGAGAWGLAMSIALMLNKLGITGIGISALKVETVPQYLSMLLVAAVLPGICEECLFRGAIQGVLERRGKWFGIICAGILFGIFHLEPARIVPAAFLGIVFGWLVVRTGSLLPAMLGHFANNSVAFTAMFLLPDMDDRPGWLIPSLIVLFFAASTLFVAITRSAEFRSTVEPSPLSQVAAGLSAPVAWSLGIIGSLFGIVVLGLMTLVTVLITIVEVDDALTPNISAGDQLLVIKRESPAFHVEAGATIAIERGDMILARIVARVEDDRVWIKELDESESEVEHEAIIGFLVQVIPGK